MGRVGGVSLYIAEKNACTEFCELDIADDHIECVFGKFHLNDQTNIVGVVYRPPNTVKPVYNDHFVGYFSAF